MLSCGYCVYLKEREEDPKGRINMKEGLRTVLITICCSIFLMTCGGCGSNKEGTTMDSIDNVEGSRWKKLGEKKIYFGHQSVGENIIDGVKDILERNPEIELNIVETDDPGKFGEPLLAHSRIGINRKPKSKIEAFKRHMEKGLGNQADMAFFKFCYVDFSKRTDVEEVFREYKTAIDELEKKHPDMVFLHCTVPLVSKESTLRTLAKKILGKTVRPYEENVVRTRFNEKLRQEYGKENALFDLAKIEATRMNGTMLSYGKGNDFMYALVPQYTDDGGHLNEVGRMLVGEQFLLFLCNAVEK